MSKKKSKLHAAKKEGSSSSSNASTNKAAAVAEDHHQFDDSSSSFEADAAAGGGMKSVSRRQPTTADDEATRRTDSQSESTSSKPDDAADNDKKKKDSPKKEQKKLLTKRQRSKVVNESKSQRWTMPSPRIQTVEGRAKASIRIAGLSQKQKQQSAQNTKLDVNVDLMNSPEVKFGRLLASVDERVRHQAVVQLKAYLTARCAIVVAPENSSDDNDSDDSDDGSDNENKQPATANGTSTSTSGLSEMDLLKLWKALWHTLYMADKVPVQEALSEVIASLLWCVAGTEEEDEYAARVYMEMMCDHDEPFDDEEEDEEQEQDDDDDDDDEDVVMEELVNTLDDDQNGEDDDGSSSSSNHDDDQEDDDDDDDSDAERIMAELQECVAHDHDDCQDNNQDHHLDEYDEENDEYEQDEEEEMDDSEILHCRGAHLASLFIRTLFQTIRREWGRMDKYRVDKFYTLIRLVMAQVFTYMAKRHWNAGIIRLFNDAIYEQVLRETPNGLRYHVIDVTLSELAKVNANPNVCPMPLTEATLIDCLEPYFAMAQTGAGGDDTVQARVLENILTKFLTHYSVARTEIPLEEQEEEGANNNESKEASSNNSLIMDQVHVGTIGQFIFDVASDPETKNQYRKSLYDLHKQYMRRLQEPGVQDVNIQLNDDDDVDDDNDMEEEAASDEDVDEENASSRKKSKKEHDADDMKEVETVEARYDADVDTPERPARNTVKKDKKKKKKFKAAASDVVADEDKITAQEPAEPAEKKKKSSKRSIEKVASTDDDNESGGAEADNEEDGTKDKKKRKKKKHKKAHRREPADRGDDEEEVTISLEEQAAAKASSLAAIKKRREELASQQDEVEKQSKKKNKKHKKDREQGQDSSATETKSVKFAPVNHARSWKASMKGLRTVKPDLHQSPEKGLLLNKDKSKKKKPTKKDSKATGRKKAIDYF